MVHRPPIHAELSCAPPRLVTPLLLVGLSAVGAAQTAPAESTPSTGSTSPVASTPAGGALAVAHPDLSGLEDVVRDQLREAREQLERELARADGTSATLAESFGGLGRLYHAYDLVPSAEDCYRHAGALSPADLRWTYHRAALAAADGRFDEAAALYETFVAEFPDDLPALVHLGEVLLAANRGDEAEPVLLHALQVSPANAAAQAALGELALGRGDHRRAITLLADVLDRFPDADRLHYPLAMAYRGLGDMDRAREHLAARGDVGVAVADPLADEVRRLASGERIHLLRGRQAFAVGRWAEAADAFAAAVAADPESHRARINLGSALGELGDVDGAVEQFRAALELAPDNVTVHFNVALLERRRGDDEAAVPHLRVVLESRPEDAVARVELAECLGGAGRLDEAVAEATRAVVSDGASPRARRVEARLLIAAGRHADARSRLELAHELMPGETELASMLAHLLIHCPDPRQRDAARALRIAHGLFEPRQSASAALLVAQALAELDRCDDAAGWLRVVIDTAERGGDKNELVRSLRAQLERYEAGPPCRPTPPADSRTERDD